ncbi:MAG: recombinase family protein [Clostridia bacterium]|nr:recombinase family protein [Clostridia bacterium]
MRDIRPRAEEKARRRTEALNAQQAEGGTRPPGAGFETERARAKQALREEVSTQTGQSVRKIAASSSDQNDDRILRVAAYCRVSTDDIDQVISIELQKNTYRDMIRANPKWKYVGTYVDDGFSGTNTEHRPAFNLMMKDAMDGKIDMIITKSVSRFARNLLDCIGCVRKLKEHDPPIPVFFEQENLNTLDTTSNIILFVLAMVAEEESHMKSEAMLLSLEWRFSRGRFITPALLGYDRVEVPDGHGGHRKVLAINENEAQTVRLMYYMLLNGSSTTEIASTLTELERETGLKKINGKPNTQWTASAVTNVMRNERYCGDVLARKTWTPNFHDHKSKKNRGKKNKYYQPGHHEAIVTRAQWNAAQRILNSHRYGHDGSYLPMRVIDRGALIGYISINRSWAGYEPDEYFRVCSIAMGMQEGDLEVDLENEHLPDGGHRIAGLTDENGVQRIARELSLVEKAVKAQLEGRTEEEEAEQRKTLKDGFQVVSAEMFSHAFEPVVRFSRSAVSFNSTCVSRLNRVHDQYGQLSMSRTEYVELLLNPVERMMVVRPCTADHPNAIRWADENGKGKCVGASAFCRILFGILGWDENYSYRVPCTVRSKGDEVALFFDLDNYIGTANGRKGEKPDEEIAAAEEAIREESEETKGIFYGADDDEEPQEIEDTEEMERRLQELAEIERRTFGTPVFEHSGDIRLPAIDDDGEWDIMAEPRILGDDHRVDDAVVESLQDELLEALIASEDEITTGGE